MLLYSREVFNGTVAEDGMQVDIPDADYIAIQTLSYVVVSGTNTLTVRLLESQDGVNWNVDATIIDGESLTTRQVNANGAGGELNTVGPRLRLELDVGTNCVAHVRVFVAGRVKKRNPQLRAAHARAAAAARSAKKEGGCGCNGKSASAPAPGRAAAAARGGGRRNGGGASIWVPGGLDLTPGLPEGAVLKSFTCPIGSPRACQSGGSCSDCLYCQAMYRVYEANLCWCLHGAMGPQTPEAQQIYETCKDNALKDNDPTKACVMNGPCAPGDIMTFDTCLNQLIECQEKMPPDTAGSLWCGGQFQACMGADNWYKLLPNLGV